MTSGQKFSDIHTERTRRKNPTSKRRFQYDERMGYSSPPRGTQIMDMSDPSTAMNVVHRTLRTTENRRKSRSIRTGALSCLRNMTYMGEPEVATTTTRPATGIHEADITGTATEQIAALPTSKRNPLLDIGTIVGISQPDGTEQLAMISEMTTFHDSKIAVVCAWIYTRADIHEDLISNGGFSSNRSHEYLQSKWPILNVDGTLTTTTARSQCDYMVSTKRIIVVSDTMGSGLTEVPKHVALKVCRDAMYHADSASRRICDVNDCTCYWLKQILCF